MKMNEMVDGSIVNTTTIEEAIWCQKCGYECEEEVVVVNGQPYHYRCAGIEL